MKKIFILLFLFPLLMWGQTNTTNYGFRLYDPHTVLRAGSTIDTSDTMAGLNNISHHAEKWFTRFFGANKNYLNLKGWTREYNSAYGFKIYDSTGQIVAIDVVDIKGEIGRAHV